MKYLIQVPSARHICRSMHHMYLYEDYLVQARAIVGSAALADECAEYLLHAKMCQYFGVRPDEELVVSHAVGKIKGAMLENLCSDFYYVDSGIHDFLESSSELSWLRNNFIGRCVSRSDRVMVVEDDPLQYSEDQLWRIS